MARWPIHQGQVQFTYSRNDRGFSITMSANLVDTHLRYISIKFQNNLASGFGEEDENVLNELC